MRYIYVILFIFSSVIIFAQDYVPIDTAILSCSYFYDFQEDSLSRASIKSEEMTLLIGSHCSLFAGTNELYRDSVLKAHSNEPFDQTYLQTITPLIQGTTTNRFCRYQIRNGYLADSVVFTCYLNKKNLKVKESNKINWEIEASRDTVILGYNCLKASAELWGRKYIAWFTIDIPISCGPYKFCGLPGLIISISDTKKQHCFNIKEIKASQQVIYYLNEQYVDITARDYVKGLEYYYADLFNRLSGGGVITIEDDGRKARILNGIKSKNNNIERY